MAPLSPNNPALLDAPGTAAFRRTAKEKGLKAALAGRDAKFGDGRARVTGPEIRDDQGRLVGE